MILEAVFDLIAAFIKLIFGFINLPDLPDRISSIINQLFDAIEGSLGLLSIFIDFDVLRILLPVLLVVINFDEVYKFVMFIVRKIPFLGIK